MRQRIEALEKALEYESMRCRGYEKLIEIADKEQLQHLFDEIYDSLK